MPEVTPPEVKPPLVLSLANLHLLDGGKATAAVNHALQQAIRDVIDRPGDKALRAVQVEFKLKPKLDETMATLDVVETQILIKSKIPHRQTTEYPMLPTDDGKLVFQEDNPMDPRQSSFRFEQKIAECIDPSTGEVIAAASPERDDENDEDDDTPTEAI